jgi:hypothetical protein
VKQINNQIDVVNSSGLSSVRPDMPRCNCSLHE